MNEIYGYPRGRLGNALFRYFAIVILLCKNKNFKYGGKPKKLTSPVVVDEAIFLKMLKNKNLNLQATFNNNLLLTDFFQFQEIVEYKDIIKDYINSNVNDTIYTDRNETFYLKDIMNPIIIKDIYDIIIHIRLEDFVLYNLFIHYNFILNLLNNLTPIFFKDNTVAIVINKPTTPFELEYLNMISGWFIYNNIKINIESNDIITDFYLMKNSKKMICSTSTMCWCAAFLSDSLNTCYMPNYDISSQTFKYPIQNTILYEIK